MTIRSDCGGRLDLDAGNLASAALDNDVYLRAILVAEMKEADRLVPPTRLSPQFLKHESFEQLTE